MTESIFWLEVMQTIVLVIGVGVAVTAIHTARKSERQKAFLAFMRDYINDDKITEAFKVIRRGDVSGKLEEKDKQALKYLLNKFEMLAIGLKGGIYDRDMIIDAFGNELLRVHTKAEPFISGSSNEEWRSDKDWLEFRELVKSIQVKVKIGKNSR